VFVGIGPQEAVGRYLAGVSHDELVDFNRDQPEFDRHGGGAPRTPPQEQGFWVARSEGTGEQPVTWDAQFGRWAVVVMNADGSRGIDIEAKAGVKVNWVIWAGLGMLIVGLLTTVGAVLVIVLVGRRASP
jgi:hypothetical protein